VKGKIHGIHGTFTIDTGASRTVLSEEIYFKIPETRRPPLTKSSILVGADGNPLVELGTAIFYIQLGTVEFEKELVVAQIDDEVLLGLDILMMGKLGPTEIKLADKCIIWNGETIPCTLVGDLWRVRNVSLADDVTIPVFLK
jgi:predicted aspartyl protease